MNFHKGTAGLRLVTTLSRVLISCLGCSYGSAGHAGYIYFETIGPHRYVVRGYVEPADLQLDLAPGRSPFHVLVHETGNDYVQREFASPTCYGNREEVARTINNALGPGVVVNEKRHYTNIHQPWTGIIQCQDGSGALWVATGLSSPPTQPVCHVTLPTLVDFGRIPQGFSPPPVRGKIRIECDRAATGEAYFSQLTSGRVRLSPDGWVTPSFNKSGGTRTRFVTEEGAYEEPVVFELSDPGTDVGVKVGQAVVIVSWS
ncbi:hypothetical protein SM14VA2_48180 (plasmid) [Serratia marcescens]|nr:hypothetical protein SM14VA2_48180 [Serratia marcescens]